MQKRSFSINIFGRHKQDLVKTLQIHHNSSQKHEMIIFWKFQLNPFIFEENIKCKEETHSIISLGASLTWNNIWMKRFCGWKTLLSCTFWQKMGKILITVFEKIPKKTHFWPFFPDFKKIEIFLKNSVKVISCPILSPKFIRNLKKVLRRI